MGWPPNDALYRTRTAVWATRDVPFGKIISWSEAGRGHARRRVTFSIPVGGNPWKTYMNSSSSCSKDNSSWLKVRCSVMLVERTKFDWSCAIISVGKKGGNLIQETKSRQPKYL